MNIRQSITCAANSVGWVNVGAAGNVHRLVTNDSNEVTFQGEVVYLNGAPPRRIGQEIYHLTQTNDFIKPNDIVEFPVGQDTYKLVMDRAWPVLISGPTWRAHELDLHYFEDGVVPPEFKWTLDAGHADPQLVRWLWEWHASTV